MKTLTLAEAADFLKLHPDSLRSRAAAGMIRSRPATTCHVCRHGQANLISRLCSSVHGNKALIFFIAARELSTAGWPWSTPRTSPGAMQPRSSDARFAAWMRQAVRAFGYAASGQCSTLSSRFTKAHVLGCASVLCFSNRYVPTGTQETPFTLPNHGRSMV